MQIISFSSHPRDHNFQTIRLFLRFRNFHDFANLFHGFFHSDAHPSIHPTDAFLFLSGPLILFLKSVSRRSLLKIILRVQATPKLSIFHFSSFMPRHDPSSVLDRHLALLFYPQSFFLHASGSLLLFPVPFPTHDVLLFNGTFQPLLTSSRHGFK
jgi:hypothetical protein